MKAQKIESFEEFMDTVLELVQASEPDFEMALGASCTIGRLVEMGHGELAMQVLETYRPNAEVDQ